MLADVGAWIGSISGTLLIGSFLALSAAEALRPKRTQRLSLGLRWTTNLGVQAVNFLLLSFIAPAAVASIVAGPLHWQPAADAVPFVGGITILVFGMLALDLFSYASHRLSHAVFPLWRLHAVHHSDIELDASTGVRHHPLEALFVAGLNAAVFAIVGLPVWVYPIYGALAVVAALLQHADVALPPRLDALLRTVIVTPAMHEVHHSTDARDYDTNFGTVFTFWDRLFGTYREAPALGTDAVAFGVDPFTAPAYAAPHWGLLLPFMIRRPARDADRARVTPKAA